MNILLTGGRAPATLDLARAFHRAGQTVFMAESLRGHLSEPSSAIAQHFLVPPPRQQTGSFIEALKDIIIQCKIDLLIPTCEEVFYVAMGRGQLPCKVFVEPIEKLDALHNKWTFMVKAIEHELSVPETILLGGQEDLLHAYAQWRGLVLKPVYSRFAARTLILPPLKKALSTLTFESPWIAQEHMQGRQICTYSICHNGHVTAHTAYFSEFTAGPGATITFQHTHHPETFDWVTKFVKATNFTGQIAFDFMQTPDGQIFALECNPRATSGVHILANHPEFINAFFDESMLCFIPNDHSSHMLSTAMLMYGLPASLAKGRIGKWLRTFFTSDDVILDGKDLQPFLLQFRSIFHYLKLAKQHGITPLEASTFDIEWNGEGG
ncbi:MAG: carbamoylphosphate synthase large subunit [Chloroflexi bacterium]|nr:carbamoylphosphate synthase large subunit [Chloroflexota bacterium]